MAALVRAAIGSLSAVGRAGFVEHKAKIERAIGIATLIRAPVRQFGPRVLGARFEQHAEAARGARVTQVVGASVDRLCAGQIALPLQEDGEIAQLLRLARLGCRQVRAGRWAHPEANPVRSQPPYGSHDMPANGGASQMVRG
jgi:hypothetical protein